MPNHYPKEIKTLGDHIKTKRLDLGLFQIYVANQIGVNYLTIKNWERNHSEPEIRYFPKIIEFLGYNPLPKPTTFVEQVTYYRLSNGMSQERCADVLGVDSCSISSWERGEHVPTSKSWRTIMRIIGEEVPSLDEDKDK